MPLFMIMPIIQQSNGRIQSCKKKVKLIDKFISIVSLFVSTKIKTESPV